MAEWRFTGKNGLQVIGASRENRVRPVLPVGDVQFSQFDLEMQAVLRIQNANQANENRIDILNAPAPVIASSDDLISVFYSIFGSNYNRLAPFDGDQEWVLAFGEDEQRVFFSPNRPFDNLEHLAQLDVEDLLTIRLYANNDVANILWEYTFFMLDVGVDLNRDGKIDLPSDSEVANAQASGSPSDKTSPDLPYRFWINDDYDVVSDSGSITSSLFECPAPSNVTDPTDVNEQQPVVCEQVDEKIFSNQSNISGTGNGTPNIERIESLRDIEDFAPLVIKLSPRLDKIKDEYYLELVANNIGINLFKGIWTDKGKDTTAHSYITNQAKTVDQVEAANGVNGHFFELQPGVPRVITRDTMKHYFSDSGIGRFIFEGIRVIQWMLGHSELSSTQIYTRVQDPALKRVHADKHPAKLHTEEQKNTAYRDRLEALIHPET
ncbi:MAG: hypothetical protein V3T17_11345 [Pseudomonadales bacterium]